MLSSSLRNGSWSWKKFTVLDEILEACGIELPPMHDGSISVYLSHRLLIDNEFERICKYLDEYVGVGCLMMPVRLSSTVGSASLPKLSC